jgi:hypothetical protein
LRIDLLKQIPEDANLGRQWNELVFREKAPQVFYTYEWALAVQRAYAQRLHPLIFLGYDDSESLKAVVALAEDRTEVSFLCATTGDYCDFIGAEGRQRRDFISAVFGQLRKQGLHRITLTNMPADSTTVSALRDMPAQFGYHLYQRTAYQCAQVGVDALRLRSGNNKRPLPGAKRLRRSSNALARENRPVSFDHLRNWNVVEPSLSKFMQAHIARFLPTGRISNLARRERQIFLHELARLLCEKGSLTLSRMTAGDQVLAWNYGFTFEGTWFWYQPTFDDDFEKYSPGFCLLAKIVEEAVHTGLATVDLGLGAEEYKDAFANQSRRTIYVTVRTSAAEHASEILRYRAAALVKRWPSLENRIRTIRNRLKRDGIGGILAKIMASAGRTLYSEAEVLFCEASHADLGACHAANLVPLDISHLANAVSQCVDDEATCEYLTRSAQRLRNRKAEGFALVDRHGNFLHFAWITDFDGFYLSELKSKVDAPSPGCVMIFDCWTPPARRGSGYYREAISALSALVKKRGKNAWIFSAASNASSIRGLQKAGFHHRFSVIARRLFGWQKIQRIAPQAGALLVREVSAGV